MRNLSVGTNSLRIVRAELPVEGPQMRASLTLENSILTGTFQNASDKLLESVAVVLGSSSVVLGDVQPGETRTVRLPVRDNPFGASLADQIVGASFNTATEEGVRQSTRYSMVQQLTYDPMGMFGSSLPGDHAVILAFGRDEILDLQIGDIAPRRNGNVLYYVPVDISVEGQVTFSSDLVRRSVIDNDAQFFQKDRLFLSMGAGTATMSYRPIPFVGTFTISEVRLSLGTGGNGVPATGDEIKPLDEIPETCTDIKNTLPEGCTPRRDDFLPEVDVFDLVTGEWARLPRMKDSRGYTLADPERYVDAGHGPAARPVRQRGARLAGRLRVPGRARGSRRMTTDRPTIVEARGLVKRYNGTIAVAGVDLSIPEGEIFGLVGPNGAGKTTMLRMLATLLQPTSGDAEIAGESVRRNPQAVRRVLGYMPDAFGVYDDMKVWEYLDFFGRCYGLGPAQRKRMIGDLLELVDLASKRDAYVQSLSRGMQQRLCLAHALVHDPKVLLLDEPASGLDPRARVELRELLRELRVLGKTILISSHILPELEELCTSVAIVDHGRVLAAGTISEIGQKLRVGEVLRIRVLGDEAAVETRPRLVRGQRGRRVGDRSTPGQIEIGFRGDEAGAAALLAAAVRAKIRVASYSPAATDLQELFLQVTDRDDASRMAAQTAADGAGRRGPGMTAITSRLRFPARMPRPRFSSGISAIIVKELRGRMRGRRAFIIITLHVLLLAVFAWMFMRIHEEQNSGHVVRRPGQLRVRRDRARDLRRPDAAPDAHGRRPRARGDGRRDQQRARAPDPRAARGHPDLVARDRPRQAGQRARLAVRPHPRVDPGDRPRVRVRRRRARTTCCAATSSCSRPSSGSARSASSSRRSRAGPARPPA